MQDNDHLQEIDDTSPIYYVGVGASAGGLEALEQFFAEMPADSGMAFIVIQHLSPDYKSMMVELLSKRTAMPVRRAEEGMRVEANSVYLIPPKKNLSIFHGKLLLSESDHLRGLNLPIDVFLRSLAEDQAEKAIGVILSGTGSDGVRGIRAIKETGGMVIAQSVESARFDGMPRATIATGLADFILPPDEMPRKLLSFIRHAYATGVDRPRTLLSDEDGLTRIFALLRERTRVDFTFYKPSTVIRRIERRMTVNQIHDLGDYVKFMESYPREVTVLYRELLIGVTSFFRDREVFDELEAHHLPRLLERVDVREVRFWVAGCSTGEEAYSLAIVSREVLERLGRRLDVKIFATDLDRDAILRASSGVYPESIAADLPPGRLAKYFHRREDHHYQVDRAIREMVVFAQHNLTKDPPFTKIDLVSCRNLLIYLQPVLQRKALERMNFSLNPQGILLLGSSETTGELAELFEPLHQKYKIYASKGNRYPIGGGLELATLPERRLARRGARFTGGSWPRGQEEERLLDRFLQSLVGDYVPLAVVVNEQMEALHILGDPEGYFRLSSGKLLNDVTKIVVKDLAIPLATGLQRVFKTGEALKYTSIRVQGRDELKTVQVRIRPLPGKKGQESLAAIFIEELDAQSKDSTAGGAQVYDAKEESEQRIRDLEQELQFSRENLQATIEELETSNEELQATNEELLASNEELQSTNEELQSVNEELQSVNEELHTVNAEHQSKIIELTELNNDLDNLMISTRIGTLFLDENLAIRRFTPEIRRLLNVLDGDVGRPVSHLVHNLENVDFLACVHQVARTGVEWEQEVRTQEGAWFLMRILPYQVGAGTVSGVVLTFTDIGLLKTTQDALLASKTQLSSLYRAAPVGIGQVVNRTLLEVNDQLCQMLGYTREELIGRSTRLLYFSNEEFELVGKTLYAPSRTHGVGTAEARWRRRDGAILPVLLTSSALNPANPEEGATFTALDLSTYRRPTERARAIEEQYRRLFDTVAEGVVYQNDRGEITYINPAAERVLGVSRDPLGERALADFHWKAIREDGADFPSDQQPSRVALRTGEPVMGTVMGVFNPRLSQTRWIRVSAVPLFESGQEKPCQVYTTFNDITEIVDVGRQLARTRRERRESEQFARAALDTLNARIAILDENGAILILNKAWRDASPERLDLPDSVGEGAEHSPIGDSIPWIDPAEAAALTEAIQAVARGERERLLPRRSRRAASEPYSSVWRIARLSGEGPARVIVIDERQDGAGAGAPG